MFTYYINGIQVKTNEPMTADKTESMKRLLSNHRYNLRTDWESYRWRLKNVKGRN